MSPLSILLIGFAMSTDAFAAAIGKGAAMRRPRLPDALRAADMLAGEWNVGADVYSVTSWSELARDGIRADREVLRDPAAARNGQTKGGASCSAASTRCTAGRASMRCR